MSNTWQTIYKSDRRKHNHRCRCCNRIIKPGDDVFMMRSPAGGSLALHNACADEPHTEDYTWREVFVEWANSPGRAFAEPIRPYRG